MNNTSVSKTHLLPRIVILLSAFSGSDAKLAPTFQSCSVGSYKARCGSLPVYENRDTRTGRIITKYFAVIKSDDPNRSVDPIFWLTGGPGFAATGVHGNISWIHSMFPDRDLVVVDQRGIGGSHEVPPPQSPDWSGLSPSELEKAYADWIEKELPSTQQLSIDCLQYLKPIPFITNQ